MNKFILMLAIGLVSLAACTPITTQTPPALSPSEPAADMTASAGATAASPTQTPPTDADAPIPVDFLQVLSPADNSVVSIPQVTVSGTASPGAVVSINDEILIVGADGMFELTVTLVEGPNLIEVIASTTSGSEASVDLVVTYQP